MTRRHVVGEFPQEPLHRETHRIGAASCWGNRGLLESADGIDDGLGALGFEEYAGRLLMIQPEDGFRSAPFCIRDNRGTAGLCLDGRDSEVLFGGKYECLGSLHVIS